MTAESFAADASLSHAPVSEVEAFTPAELIEASRKVVILVYHVHV